MNDQDRSILIRFFVGLAIVLLLIFLVWFIFFRHTGSHKGDAPQPAKTTATQQAQPTPHTTAPSYSAPSQKQGAVNSPTPGSTTPTKQNNPQLTNTGPGANTLVLVGMVSLVAGLGHYYGQRRRWRKKELL